MYVQKEDGHFDNVGKNLFPAYCFRIVSTNTGEIYREIKQPKPIPTIGLQLESFKLAMASLILILKLHPDSQIHIFPMDMPKGQQLSFNF